MRYVPADSAKCIYPINITISISWNGNLLQNIIMSLLDTMTKIISSVFAEAATVLSTI